MRIKGISNVVYFSKGKRGLIYTGTYKKTKVAVKVKRKESEAVGRIENEANYLKLLNKHSIGPEFVMFKDKKLIYKFVEGIFIEDFIKKTTKKRTQQILKQLFLQCFKLDQLKINKEEMSHPQKHILISRKPVLIDFERSHTTEKPKNVTQFCQYITSGSLTPLLKEKGIKINKKMMIKLAKNYKSNMNKKNLDKIIRLFSSS